MANRRFNQFSLTLEKQVVKLYGSLTAGASGAVASSEGLGIKSITKESTDGQYTIQLEDGYPKLLHVQAIVKHASASAVAAAQIISEDAKAGTITIQLTDGAGAAVNPESAAVVMLEITLRNSSVGK